MVLHPECQARAQAEIDKIVDGDRLPEFHDRESLPYVEGILQETLRRVALKLHFDSATALTFFGLIRWRPAVPMGVLRI